MHTHRLRTFVDSRQARLLLDSYVATIGGLPAVAIKRLDLAKLPLAFQERAEQAESQGLVCSAWTHGSNAWLFIGQLSLNRARERGQPVLEVDIPRRWGVLGFVRKDMTYIKSLPIVAQACKVDASLRAGDHETHG